MIKCCIFDLDGTLVESLQDLADATNFSLQALNLPTHDIEEYRYMVGNGVSKLIERALPENEQTDENKQKMRKIFDKKYNECCLNNTRPFDCIYNLLAALKKQNVKLAVVTNKPDTLARKIINNLFENFFSEIHGNTENFPTKPAPDLALFVAKNLKLEPKECAFIGDSDVDMQTAVNAGMLPIGATWGFRSRLELQNAGAKHLVDSPYEILNIIDTSKCTENEQIILEHQ